MGGSKKLLGRGPGLAHVSWSIPVFKLFFEDVGMACRTVQPSQYEHLCHPPLQCIICLCLYDVGWLAYALYFWRERSWIRIDSKSMFNYFGGCGKTAFNVLIVLRCRQKTGLIIFQFFAKAGFNCCFNCSTYSR